MIYRHIRREAWLRSWLVRTVHVCYQGVANRDQRIAEVIWNSVEWSPALCDWIYFKQDSDIELLRPLYRCPWASFTHAIRTFQIDLSLVGPTFEASFCRGVRSALAIYSTYSHSSLGAGPLKTRTRLLNGEIRRPNGANLGRKSLMAQSLRIAIESIRAQHLERGRMYTHGLGGGTWQFVRRQETIAAVRNSRWIATLVPELAFALEHWKSMGVGYSISERDGTRLLIREYLDQVGSRNPILAQGRSAHRR